MKFNKNFLINRTKIGWDNPTYFIADIAANHNGKLSKALKLIELAAESGANAAKFQHFKAETIVSDFEFKKIRSKLDHQSKWKKSVFEVYKEASIPLDWTEKLKKKCKECGIDFFSAIYDLEYLKYLNKKVSAFKIGSGDITWHEMLKKTANYKKPIFIATGASTFNDVKKAIDVIKKKTSNICLMQCNTNYTASLENFKYINLNVLNSFKKKFPNLVLGLSDHTPGHATVLGAIAMGARVIEKHFTDNNNLSGPDHLFSMNPKSWKIMVLESRNLENSLGNGIKIIEDNEKKTSIIQRRSICTNRFIGSGQIINRSDLICLRPAPKGSVIPYDINKIIGKKIKKNKNPGEAILWKDLK